MSKAQLRKPARTKSREKRQRILDATAKLIAQGSSLDFTLQDVGAEVGMYAASIYYYFPSREDLIREVHEASLDRFRSKMEEAIAELPDNGSPVDRLKAAIVATVETNSSVDDYALAYTRALNKATVSLDESVRAHRQAIRDLWLTLLKDAQDAGQLSKAIDLNLLRFFLTGAIHWVSFWYRPDGPSGTEEISDAFFDFLINGAGPAKRA